MHSRVPPPPRDPEDPSEAVFRDIYARVMHNGKIVSPRGQRVIEVENFTYELPARVRFANFVSRKLSLDYIKREFLWYLRGNAGDLSICDHAKMWASLVTEDKTINSNYGQYIFAKIWLQADTQFSNVIQLLQDDKDSRRASIMILSAKHLLTPSNDYPCTYCLNFRIRDNKLNMSVHMRSQDAVFGMGNDAPTFSFIQEMVYMKLRDTYVDLELGTYHHICDSFHVYEKHWDMTEKIATGVDPYIPVTCPQIENSGEVNHLLTSIHLTYGLDINDMNVCPDTLRYIRDIDPMTLEVITNAVKSTGYKFASWLTTFEKETK